MDYFGHELGLEVSRRAGGLENQVQGMLQGLLVSRRAGGLETLDLPQDESTLVSRRAGGLESQSPRRGRR